LRRWLVDGEGDKMVVSDKLRSSGYIDLLQENEP